MVDMWFNIPDREGWQALRLKRLVTLQTNKVDRAESDRPYIGLEHVESGYGRLLPVAETAENEEENSIEGTANAFEPGDVLFGKLRPYLAKAYRAEAAGCCSPELLVLTPGSKLDGRFLLYTLLTPNFISLVNSTAFGAKMPRADWNAIGNIFIPLPRLKQQHAIIDFLDHEIQRLDQLAAARQQQLALLEEKRRALIAQAVTQGLDAQAPRRDSGFAWLGQVPAHWEVVQLKRMCKSILTGSTPKNLEIDNQRETINWFTPGDLSDNELKLTESERKLSATLLAENEVSWFPEKSVMVVGVGASLGKVGVTNIAASANQQINVLLPQESADSWYMAYQLQALRDVLFAHSLASTLPILSQQRMGETIVAFPPIKEQTAIVGYIEKEVSKFTELIQHINRSLNLIQQKRASLITAAVTGQLIVS